MVESSRQQQTVSTEEVPQKLQPPLSLQLLPPSGVSDLASC